MKINTIGHLVKANPIKPNFKILLQRNGKKKGLWESAEKAILFFYVAKMIFFRAKYIPSSLY